MRQKDQKKLRILILAHYYPPEMGGAAARIHGLVRWLVNYGNQVTVLTGFPNYPSGIIQKEYRGKLRAHEWRDNVEVIRTWVYATSHQKNFGRLSNYLTFVLSSIITYLCIKRKHDVIVASSPPLFIGISGLFLSRVYRIPFVFDIRDIWPDVAVDAGAFRKNNPLILLGKKLAKFLYKKADHITPVTDRKLEKIVADGIDDQKVTVVPNGVDLDRLRTTKANMWRTKLGLENHFVAIYTGLIGIAQGVGVIIEAANHLKNNPVIHFLIVGDGVEREQLISRVKELGLTNITFLQSQPSHVIPSMISSADISLVPLVSANLTDAVPSKLMEAWGCRKPVILAAEGEAASLVEQAQGGVVIPPQNPNRLAETITTFSKNSDALSRYADDGYAFVRAHFDRRDLALKLEAVLMKVSKRRME